MNESSWEIWIPMFGCLLKVRGHSAVSSCVQHRSCDGSNIFRKRYSNSFKESTNIPLVHRHHGRQPRGGRGRQFLFGNKRAALAGGCPRGGGAERLRRVSQESAQVSGHPRKGRHRSGGGFDGHRDGG